MGRGGQAWSAGEQEHGSCGGPRKLSGLVKDVPLWKDGFTNSSFFLSVRVPLSKQMTFLLSASVSVFAKQWS